MKRYWLLLGACFALFLFPGILQAQSAGLTVTCDDGTSFENGIGIRVSQMRAGFTYTATAVGLNGFDPVLAVLDSATGAGFCSDDNTNAAKYAANLPTTGQVPASALSAQVDFSQNTGNTFADISLVVGGYGNQTGEFLLILEGMAATASDNAGDVFDVDLTPGMVASGIPLTTYMITRGQSAVDTYIALANDDLTTITDQDGKDIACDDAGDSGLCWGDSVDLTNSSVTIATGTLPGWQYDSMLSLDLSGLELENDVSNYLTFVMRSSPQNPTEGQYLLVFDIGTTEAPDNGKSSFSSGGEESGSNQTVPTPVPQNNTKGGGDGMGVSVTCDDGNSFDNGVEVLMGEMESGVTYTATAIGLNGFDPVLAVLNADTGDGLCSDDNSAADGYAVDLPTTGSIPASELTSQITFTQDTGNRYADMSLVVGGYGNTGGEFLLILEGMSATASDNGGDVINVNITPGMINSGVPLTIYMIATTNALDPYIVRTDADLNPIEDNNGDTIACDDAGTANFCWGDSTDLSDSSLTLATGDLPGGSLDAMLTRNLSNVSITDNREQNWFVYLASASPNTAEPTSGGYVLVFHIGQAG